jgi:hypothetical protein
MTTKAKKTLVTIVGIVALLALGVATLIVIPKLSQTDKSVAPTAPESKPKAADDWMGAATCNTSFTVTSDSLTCQDGLNDNFDGSALDASKWVAFDSGNIALVDGKLKITPGNSATSSAFVQSSKHVSGDFQSEVEIASLNGTLTEAGTEVNASIALVKDSSAYSEVVLWKNNAGSHVKLIVRNNGTTTSGEVINISGTPASIKLRMTREGGRYKGYYNDGNGWNELPAVTIEGVTDATGYLRIIHRHINLTSSSAEFDNFTLTCIPTVTITLTPTATLINTPTATPTLPLGVPTPTPTRGTFLPTPTPTPTTPTLPDAGIGLPTLGALGGGTVMILLGILLAL